MALHAPLLCTLFAFLVAMATGCSDYWSTSSCESMKSIKMCALVSSNCQKTCEKCPDVTNPTGPKCGISTVMGSRVIAGTRAKPGAWPWQVLLLNYGNGGCGGSLITPTWVVTASHCVDADPSPRRYSVGLGVNDIRVREPSAQVIRVKRVIMHPYYRKSTIANDIALLELEQPAILNDKVATVCLPDYKEQVPIGTMCYVTGWGKTRHPGSGSPTLQQVAIPVVSQRTCSYLNTRNSGITITEGMLCAGYGPRRRETGCHGDSGGPFVCPNKDGGFTLQGAVSWGSATCDTRDSYSVYAKVAVYRRWIDKYVKS